MHGQQNIKNHKRSPIACRIMYKPQQLKPKKLLANLVSSICSELKIL